MYPALLVGRLSLDRLLVESGVDSIEFVVDSALQVLGRYCGREMFEFGVALIEFVWIRRCRCWAGIGGGKCLNSAWVWLNL